MVIFNRFLRLHKCIASVVNHAVNVVSVTALTMVISLTLATIHGNMTRKNLIPDVFLFSDTPYMKKDNIMSENIPTPKKRHSAIIKFTIVATVLPIIYIILSLINIYNVNISTSIFHETYEFWKDSTWFMPLSLYFIECYIYSVIFVVPYIIVCMISIFSEKLKGKKKLRYSVISFLIFLFSNYINMDEIYQSTCSDNWVMIELVSRLQNILMWLNIASFLLVCCTAVIEIRTTSRNKSKKL